MTRLKPGRSGSDQVKRMVEEAHDEAIRLLTENRGRLDGIVEALLCDETLDQPQACAAAGLLGRKDEAAPVEAAAPVATLGSLGPTHARTSVRDWCVQALPA